MKALEIKGSALRINKDHGSAALCYMLFLEWLAEKQIERTFLELGRSFRVHHNAMESYIDISCSDTSVFRDLYNYISNNI